MVRRRKDIQHSLYRQNSLVRHTEQFFSISWWTLKNELETAFSHYTRAGRLLCYITLRLGDPRVNLAGKSVDLICGVRVTQCVCSSEAHGPA